MSTLASTVRLQPFRNAMSCLNPPLCTHSRIGRQVVRRSAQRSMSGVGVAGPSSLSSQKQSKTVPATNFKPTRSTPPPPKLGEFVHLQTPWPWRPIPSLLSSQKGTKRYERTIYARPLASSPLRNLVLALALGGVGVMFALIPDKPRMPDWWSQKEIGLPARLFGTFNNYLLLDAPPYLAAIGMVVSLYRIGKTTRIITRLKQIRTVSTPVAGEVSGSASALVSVKETETTVIQLWTGKHSLLPFSRPRELNVDDIKIEAFSIGRGKTPTRTAFLNLTILPTAKDRSWQDKKPYYLDYRDSRYLSETEEDVVLSLNRVENVFGRVALERSDV